MHERSGLPNNFVSRVPALTSIGGIAPPNYYDGAPGFSRFFCDKLKTIADMVNWRLSTAPVYHHQTTQTESCFVPVGWTVRGDRRPGCDPDTFHACQVVAWRLHAHHHHQNNEHKPIFQQWRFGVSTALKQGRVNVEEAWTRSIGHGELSVDLDVKDTREAGSSSSKAACDIDWQLYLISVCILLADPDTRLRLHCSRSSMTSSCLRQFSCQAPRSVNATELHTGCQSANE